MTILGWSAQTSTPATQKAPAKTRATAAKKSSTSASKSSTALHRKGSGVTKSSATHKPGSTSHRTSAGAATGPGTGSSTAGKSASARSSASRRGKKGAATTAARRPATTWRNRQLAPTPDRYKEIQNALAAKGYLKPEEATGTWGPSSGEALKRFQADQNLDASGKLTAMSLIALGLGPKHETAMAKPPDPR